MSWAIDVWICGLMVVWIYRSSYLWINWLTKPATEEYTNNALTKTTLLFRKRACFDQNKHVLETCLFKTCLFLMKVLIKTSMFRSMPVLMPVLIKTGMFRNMRVLFRNMPVLMRVSKHACFDQNRHVSETCFTETCLFWSKQAYQNKPVLIKTGPFKMGLFWSKQALLKGACFDQNRPF